MVDCLNYEVTDVAGYRRIDGYESYDGYPNGAISEYYRLQITAELPAHQALFVTGSIISRSNRGLDPVRIGVIVGGPFNSTFYDVVPFTSSANFIVTEDFLVQQNGVDFIQLQTGAGLLKILGEVIGLGSTFTVTPPSGVEYEVTITSTPQLGGVLVTAEEYLSNIRAYSAALRAQVNNAPGHIAGLYWLQDRLFAAVNAAEMRVLVDSGNPQPVTNRVVRWNGTLYSISHIQTVDTGTVNDYRMSLLPIGTSPVVDDRLVQVLPDGTEGTVWVADVSATGDVSTDNSEYAYLGYFNTPAIGASRGFTYLPPSYNVSYSSGNFSSALGPALTLGDGPVPSDVYYVVGGDGSVYKARLSGVRQSGGAWTAGTSVGLAQLSLVEKVAGNRYGINNGDIVHNAYPTTGSSAVFTVSAQPSIGAVAGTLALDRNNSRYQWDTYNFYGQSNTSSAYGANGAGPSFWANRYAYGVNPTGLPVGIDKPRYLAFHGNSIALGYEQGSVMLSVPGEPFNFNGVDGAVEIATGDKITGMLEMPGDALAVFGQRTIRKISGIGDGMTLSTISGSSGAFDYSAVLLGQQAVFAGVNGITTLEQTAAYGDFTGTRLSDKISNYLRPRLLTGTYSQERGGVAFAYPVRTKNQYRLVLYSGEVIILTLTSEGPKITLANWGLIGETRVPYAWSSEVSSIGRERIHAVWSQRELRNRVLELEQGWGFDGKVFNHYFDTGYIFNNNGANSGGIEKVRLYGQGYGASTLDVKSSGIETDFTQGFHSGVQDISIPRNIVTLYDSMQPVTNITNQANWGLGVKLRFRGTTSEGSTLTEPAHNCQSAVLHIRTQGATDS